MYLLLCYCIGYTSNNDWSTSIISALHYTVVPDIILIFILCTFIHVILQVILYFLMKLVWSIAIITLFSLVLGTKVSGLFTKKYINDWSTSIIPLDQYQEKLQERRREWEASQPVEPEDRREIDRLTRVLQERERELQEVW